MRNAGIQALKSVDVDAILRLFAGLWCGQSSWKVKWYEKLAAFTWRDPGWVNPRRNTPRHIVIKIMKIKTKIKYRKQHRKNNK